MKSRILAVGLITALLPVASARAAIMVTGDESSTWTSPDRTHYGHVDVRVNVSESTPDDQDDIAAYNLGVSIAAPASDDIQFTGISALPSGSGFTNPQNYPLDSTFPRTQLVIGDDVAEGTVDLSDLPGLVRIHYSVAPNTADGTYFFTFDSFISEFVNADGDLLTDVTFQDAAITLNVPEPGTAMLAAVAGAGLLLRRRRQA